MTQLLQPALEDRDDLTSWSLQFRATSECDPARLVQTLTGAILGCGGWILSRGTSDSGLVHMAFEFERDSCEEMYLMLVAVGLNISIDGHRQMTQLCQCTRLSDFDCRGESVAIEVEIETSSADLHAFEPSSF